MKITVGIPAYNEEKNIASIIENLSKIADTIIVCNDGSSDNTGKLAEKMGAIVINHERNLGYGAAIRSLFLRARELGSDVLVTMDSDGQHRISDVLPVAEPIMNNQADLVIGSRFLEGNQENIPKYRKIGIKMITKLANASLEDAVTDSQSGFRAYSKNVLSTITPSEYGMGVSNEILMKASKNGFKIAEVPIVVSYEGETSTHHPISHGASVTLSTLKFISIEHPLKFYGIPGLIFLAVGLIFTIMTIQGFTETRQILLSTAVIGVGTIIFGTVLLMTSIILYSVVNLIRENSSK
ncbi:MAG: glycosyltransferase family 2 protein [Nitrosarchaeum sp.]|nr:glycosyltransferase family 2 protein [Nitrosarchaeum sp.]